MSPQNLSTPVMLGHFINGQHVVGRSERTSDVFNPAAGAVSTKVGLGATAEVDVAVAVAKAGFPASSALPFLYPAKSGNATLACIDSGWC